MTSRRNLLIFCGLGVIHAASPLHAREPRKVWTIGVLAAISRPPSIENHFLGAFIAGMRELGYFEGKDFTVEWRFAESNFERLPALAAELVGLQVDLIIAGNNPAATAAQKATRTIPIVMGAVADPVGFGLVASLRRPGGNITGMSIFLADLSAKRLAMLKSALPHLSNVGVLVNPAAVTVEQSSMFKAGMDDFQATARTLGVKCLQADARTPGEIERAIALMAREHVEGVLVALDAFFGQQRHQIAELALKHRLPAVGSERQFAEAGFLLSYGPNIAANFRHAATYVDKIFRGASPAELPVEQPTTFELVINMVTARALGVTIPQSLVVSANHLIE